MQIYKTTNIVNKKVYIGKDVRDKTDYLGSGKILKLAIKKYGRKNFKKEILETCKTIKELNLAEIYWINQFKSFSPRGYNISTGGKGGDNISNNPNREEICEQQRDKNNPFFGKHHKKKAINKIKKTSKENWKKDEYRNKQEVILKKANKIQASNKKNKTYEEIYGEEKAKEIKKKQNRAMKGKHWKVKDTSNMKGKYQPNQGFQKGHKTNIGKHWKWSKKIKGTQ